MSTLASTKPSIDSFQFYLPTISVNFDSGNPELFASADNEDVSGFVDFIASKETPVRRFNWWTGETFFLVLSHDPKDVDLSRVSDGVVMFIEDHFTYAESQIGKVMEAKLEKGQLKTRVKVDTESEKGKAYLSKVRQKIAPGISIGADIFELKVIQKAEYEIDEENNRKRLKTPATLKATKWQLVEQSSVITPAISGTGVDQSSNTGSRFSDLPMHTVTLEGETGYSEEDFQRLFHLKDLEMPTKLENGSDLQLSEVQADNAKLTAELTQLTQQNQQLTEQLKEAEDKLKKLSSDFSIERKYQKLRFAAEKLVNDCKMSKAAFDRNFGSDESADIIALQTSGNGQAKLDYIADYLEQASNSDPILNNQNELKGQELTHNSTPDPVVKKREKAHAAYTSAWQNP